GEKVERLFHSFGSVEQTFAVGILSDLCQQLPDQILHPRIVSSGSLRLPLRQKAGLFAPLAWHGSCICRGYPWRRNTMPTSAVPSPGAKRHRLKPASPPGARRVVVVNGNAQTLELLATDLEHGRYDVVFVASHENAYSHVKRLRP